MNSVNSVLIHDSHPRGSHTVPSYVYFHPETEVCYVGQAALYEANKLNSVPQNLLHSYKRLLGKRYSYACFLWCSRLLTLCRMSEKGAGENIETLQRSLGNVVLRGVGPAKDRIRYVVKVGNPDKGYEEKEVKPTTCVGESLVYLLCQHIYETKEFPELIITSVPGTYGLPFMSLWCLYISSAIQNMYGYIKMKKLLDAMGIQVLNVMAEPVGSWVWNNFREIRDNNESIYGNTPECLRVEHVLDLGAGMWQLILQHW